MDFVAAGGGESSEQAVGPEQLPDPDRDEDALTGVCVALELDEPAIDEERSIVRAS